MSFLVRKAPLFASIQDAGRPGYARYGVPVSGYMDDHSARMANALVGNAPEAAVIEIAVSGGSFECREHGLVAVTGAECECAINDRDIPMNRSHFVAPGDILSIGRITQGRYVYLAAQGLRTGAQVMGSYSTCLQAGFGGMKGGRLQAGQEISYTPVREGELPIRSVPARFIPHFGAKQTIRVVEGPEFRMLDEEERDKLLKARFVAGINADRMGLRMQAKEYRGPDCGQITSSPVIPGIIQYPGDAGFIILLRDAQTIGGYPRLLKVIDAEIWRISQCTPGTEIRLKLVDTDEAISRYQYMQDLYAELEKD